MSEHWTDRLSEYLDGELEAPDRTACEGHLQECEACAATVEELRSLVSDAALLPDLPPERDLWPDIEARLPARAAPAGGADPSAPEHAGWIAPDETGVISLAERRRRVVMTVPQLIAAAIALVLLSAGSVWLMLPGAAGTLADAGAAAPTAGSGATAAAVPVVLTGTAYDDVVAELEREFDRRRTELDPETIRVVESNLAIIDDAIAEARAALESDPSSGFLSTHLANAMRRKVDLLRQAAAIEQKQI